MRESYKGVSQSRDNAGIEREFYTCRFCDNVRG